MPKHIKTNFACSQGGETLFWTDNHKMVIPKSKMAKLNRFMTIRGRQEYEWGSNIVMQTPILTLMMSEEFDAGIISAISEWSDYLSSLVVHILNWVEKQNKIWEFLLSLRAKLTLIKLYPSFKDDTRRELFPMSVASCLKKEVCEALKVNNFELTPYTFASLLSLKCISTLVFTNCTIHFDEREFRKIKREQKKVKRDRMIGLNVHFIECKFESTSGVHDYPYKWIEGNSKQTKAFWNSVGWDGKDHFDTTDQIDGMHKMFRLIGRLKMKSFINSFYFGSLCTQQAQVIRSLMDQTKCKKMNLRFLSNRNAQMLRGTKHRQVNS